MYVTYDRTCAYEFEREVDAQAFCDLHNELDLAQWLEVCHHVGKFNVEVYGDKDAIQWLGYFDGYVYCANTLDGCDTHPLI